MSLPSIFPCFTQNPLFVTNIELIGFPKTSASIFNIFFCVAEIKGLKINDILTVNGIRFSLEDGSWGLIRASSNKPSLVVVTESPTSDELKKEIYYFIDKLLQETGKIGEYDQKIN